MADPAAGFRLHQHGVGLQRLAVGVHQVFGVRRGCAGEAQCLVEATFRLEDPKPVNTALAEAGLEPCEDGQLILRRVVKAAGGGQAYVNDTPVTLPLLKRLGALLVGGLGPRLPDRLKQLTAEFYPATSVAP